MRILIVDDAPIMRTLFTRIADELGHTVAGEASTPHEAALLARSLGPDAIVVDGRLVGSDLPELIVRLREAAAGGAVFVVAALDETVIASSAVAGGAAGVLLRPFARAQVRELLGPARPAARERA